jgi:DNA topoisomerase-1
VPKSLVIVESPAKAKTIARFLGADFVVEASMGHVRDLPRGADDVPEEFKGLPWARTGVDVDNDFKPLYIVPRERREQIRRLKAALKGADQLYLATDEDREGESISWHLLEVLAPRVPVRRMVFHEITSAAIERAVRDWRELDLPLVDAQETRRILDRLYGYEVSPVLWKKVMPGLSAGRVQSVATRIVVERERARMRFRSAGWWDLEGTFAKAADGSSALRFRGTLVALDGRRLVSGKDFGENGELSARATDVVRLDQTAAQGLGERLVGAAMAVRSVDEKPYTARPQAPFMTSTLQQEAGRKLRFDSRRAMQVAQRLYENGYITYMRTDSTNLSETALAAARRQATELYGQEYVPANPRVYSKKVKNAQEAHEAIRPAGESFRTPDQVTGELTGDELRLYDLIWKRTVASQMADARGQTVQVRSGGRSSAGEDVEFASSGKVITFPGFLRAYVEGADDPDAELEDQETPLPALVAGDDLRVDNLEAKGHATSPPARYTEASLVKALEELGVGRPSTYASIMGTIQDRGYAWKKGSALVPSWTAFAVVALLERHFAQLVDYAFTARMEDDLDEIAARRQERVPWLNHFYFGSGGPAGMGNDLGLGSTPKPNGDGSDDVGLKLLVTEHLGEIDARDVNSIAIGTDADGNELVVRVGRFGPYLQRDQDRASLPDDLAPDELTVERASELLDAPAGDRVLGPDPATGLVVSVRNGRFGAYVQLGEQVEGGPKPARGSLFKSMTPDSVSLEQALQLLSLPRVVGLDPADGAEITAQNGRYGPYIKKGTDSRSLAGEEQLLNISLGEALAILSEPKRGRGRVAAPPLRELGPDPVSGEPMVIKEGRFGPYVTDGTTNASLKANEGDAVETLDAARGAQLLQLRREAGPVKGRRGGARKSVGKTAKASASTKKAASGGPAMGTKRAGATTAGAKTPARKTAATKTTKTAKASAKATKSGSQPAKAAAKKAKSVAKAAVEGS